MRYRVGSPANASLVLVCSGKCDVTIHVKVTAVTIGIMWVQGLKCKLCGLLCNHSLWAFKIIRLEDH